MSRELIACVTEGVAEGSLMMKRLPFLLLAGGGLAGVVACTPGESGLSSGAAAGAGISALLGQGQDSANAANAGAAGEASTDRNLPVTGEDGLRYYGPL